jgi:tungstate transport system ATP-binding protein
VSAPAIAVSGLSKHFGARRLLDIGELTIEDGAGYVLTGANGSGKTTLLRILAGLESATVREFAYRGEPTGLAPYPERLRRAVVYVHQHPYLFHTSLRHNIEYGLRCRKLPAAERARRTDDAIAWAGLGAQVDTPPAKLSGGEKQRAALARARALSPDVLLLDEPTANLDRDGRAKTLALLAQLRSERRTVVIACHDQEVIGLPRHSRLYLEDGGIRAA